MTKNIWILDFLKAIFIFFVIVIHANSYLILGFDNNPVFVYGIELAVPCFMIISGYTFSISASKRNNWKENYLCKNIIPKIIRFLIPMIIPGISHIFICILKHDYSRIGHDIITVSFGPGSYYFALMLELVLIFPIIFALVQRQGGYSAIIMILINFGFEIIATISDMSHIVYSRNVIRFIGFVAIGCWLFRKMERKEAVPTYLLVVSGLIGGIWIYYTRYANYTSSIFTKDITYALPTLFWVWPILYVVIGHFGKYVPSNPLVKNIFQSIGKASYHILCVQMIWFTFLIGLKKFVSLNALWATFISLIISLLGGIAFYQIDAIFLSRLKSWYSHKFQKSL